MNSEVRHAISGLYAAFHRPDGAPIVRGCPCCTEPGEFEALIATPLRQLSADALERYTRKALTTAGDAEAFRYFLPRIVELAVAGAFIVEREVIFGKLAYADWLRWPDRESSAMRLFARAVSDSFAVQAYDADELDSWVCALGQFVDDFPMTLQPLLCETAQARANRRALVRENADYLVAGKLMNAFWAKENPNRQVFFNWLRLPGIQPAAG